MRNATSSGVTPHQMAVLQALARTGDVQMAARQLGIAPNTVGKHRDNAYARLGVHSAREAWVVLGWLRTP